MFVLIIATLAFLLLVLAVRIKASTQSTDERFQAGNIPLVWWVCFCVIAGCLLSAWTDYLLK